MSEELLIGGKSYISSKQAASTTGYAQDYIGQLCRGGLIDAQRVGGLWYVYLDSLTAYKTRSADFKPQAPANAQPYDPESVVSFDGKDYISASRAAKITGYNQDYVGQLARGGKILSRQMGNRWYVDREGLLSHKQEKDSLLAAVQSEAVGLKRAVEQPAYASAVPTRVHYQPVATANLKPQAAMSRTEQVPAQSFFTYISEKNDLLPAIEHEEQQEIIERPAYTPIAIRKVDYTPVLVSEESAHYTPKETYYHEEKPKNGVRLATQGVVALTIVVVLSYGLVSLRQSSVYASAFVPHMNLSTDGYAAGAAFATNRLGDILESLVTKNLTYVRPN